jgi:flagellar hook-associated protein 2
LLFVTPLMPTITSLGSGSGLDLESLVSKLVSAERIPITQLSAKTNSLKTELSAFGKVQSSLAALRDAASRLTKPDTWGGSQATSSDATAVTASAGSGAAVGTVQVEVRQLASAQTLAGTTPYASASTVVGEGSLTIQLGSWGDDGNGSPSFIDKAGSAAITVTIGPGQDTLAGIRDQINAAGAGVNASIINDANGARLVLRSSETGASNGFRIDATGGLTDLGYDPRNGVSQMVQTLPAQNARAVLNGIDVSSETNTLKSAIDGLNITLLKMTQFPASVTVSQDKDAIRKAISDFTSAYNAVNALLREQTKYDSASKSAGVLQGDATANGLQAQLRGIMGGSSSLGGAFARLAQVGIDPGSDGNLTTSASKLDTALTDTDSLKQLFMGLDSGNAGNSGFAQRIRSYVDGALGTEGRLTSRQSGLQKLIDNNGKRADALEDRVAQVEVRLRARYSALDAEVGKLNSLSSYVSQQMAQLNKN